MMAKPRVFHRLIKLHVCDNSNQRSVRSLSYAELLKRVIQYCGLGNDGDTEGWVVPELNELCWRLVPPTSRQQSNTGGD